MKVNREMTRALGVVTSMLAIGPLLVIAIKETLEQKQYPAFVMDWSIPFSLVLWFGAVWGCGFLVGVGRRDE